MVQSFGNRRFFANNRFELQVPSDFSFPEYAATISPPHGDASHKIQIRTVGRTASTGILHRTYIISLISSIKRKLEIQSLLKSTLIAESHEGSASINFLRSCFNFNDKGARKPGGSNIRTMTEVQFLLDRCSGTNSSMLIPNNPSNFSKSSGNLPRRFLPKCNF